MSGSTVDEIRRKYGVGTSSNSSSKDETPSTNRAPTTANGQLTVDEIRQKYGVGPSGRTDSSTNDRVDEFNRGVDAFNQIMGLWGQWYDAAAGGLDSVGWADAQSTYEDKNASVNTWMNKIGELRKWVRENQDMLGENYDAAMQQLEGASTSTYWLNRGYSNTADYYSQWDSQEAYDQTFAPTAQEEVMGKDVGQMQSDLDAMQQAYDDLDEILVYREAGYGTVPEAEREQKKAWHDQRYQEILDAYGVNGTVSKWDLMARISELEDEIGETSDTQEGIRAQNAEANRLAGYYMKYDGMDYSQLKQAMETVTDPQEKAWLQSYAGTKMTAADYDVEIPKAKALMEELDNTIEDYRDQYEYWERLVTQYSTSADPEDWAKLGEAQEKMNIYLDLITQTEVEKQVAGERHWNLEHNRKYVAVRENADFDEKSGYVTAFVDANGDVVDTTEHPEYRYINSKGNPDAFLQVGSDRYIEDATWIEESGKTAYGTMNQEEVRTYNYIVRTQGWDAANEYLSHIMPTLEERSTAEFINTMVEFTKNNPLLANAASVAANAVAGLGILDLAAQNLGRTFSGTYKPINYYGNSMTAAHMSRAIRGTTAAMITDEFGVIDLDQEDHPYLAPILNGRGLADVYQLGISAIDSKVAALTGNPVLATILLASSAATNGVLDALERGATDEQALTMGLWNGAFEALFEFAEVDALLKGNPNWVKAAVNQAITEGVGEGATDVANSIADAIIMADKSKVMENARKYMEENPGMTENEAIWRAVGDAAIDAGWSMVGGAVSGGFSAGGQSMLQNYSSDMASGRYVQENQMQDPLMQLAQSMAGANTGKLNTYAQMAAERQSTRNMGRLYNEVNRVVDRQNMDQLAQALEGHGLSRKDATHLATAIGLDINGIELTKSQEKLLKQYEDSEKVMAAVKDVLGSTAFLERNASVRNLGATQKKTPTAAQEAPGQAKAAEKTTVPEAKIETSHAVSEDGKTHLIEEPDKAVSIQGIESIKDGKMMLELNDGSVVDSESVSYGDDGEALIYEVLSDMGASAENANAIYQDFKASGKPATEFALDLQEAYQYGTFNQPLKEGNNSPAAQIAWNEGRMAVISRSDKRQAEVEQTYEKATEALKQSGKDRRTDHHAVLAENITALSLTESQKASYELADRVAQAAKVDIVVYDGEALEQGYYKGDTVYLNLNASNKNRQSMMAFVLGHELVHRAKKGSPKKYQAFADFLVEQYGKQGSDVDAMIAEQMQAAKDNGIEMTTDEAFEEVVADACQRMLLDTDAGLKLAQFGAENKQHKSILDDIKRWITEFIEKLRSIFKDVEPGSLAAQEFAKFEDGVKQILADMYVDMTMEAGEHLSAIKEAFGEEATIETNDRGEFTMAQNADGSEKVFNLVTWRNGGRATLEATLLREGYSREEVDAALTIMDGKQELVESIANEVTEDGKMAFPEQGRINEATLTTDIKNGHSVLSALVSNGDYPVNIDLLMVCKKRKAYQRVINRLCETGLIRQATVDALAIAQINKILGKYGFETACLGCFVESRRLRIQEWAQTIVSEWNSEVRKRDPNAKAFGFGKGEATLTPDEVMQLVGELESGGDKNDKGNLNLGQGSAVKRMGVLLDKVPSLRKTLSMEDLVTPEGLTALRRMDSNLFSMVKSRYGSNSPKFVQEFNPYNHELAMYGKVPKQYKSLREYLYAIGGARMQSFSDFIVENWFDYCQIVADLAARNLPMHTYTKEIAMVKLFGMTGIKINMSLIPDVDRSLGKEYAGLTINEDGQLELIWSDKDRFKATDGTSYMQSINFADAMALQNDPRYSSNVGTIAIGISDRQIRMMLNDSRIRMVIPYHSSGMNPIFADLMGTSFYKDYTNFQNTTVKQMYDSNGKPVKVKLDKTEVAKLTSGFQFNEVLQELGDARAAAEAYKEWCADASKHTITLKGKTYTAELTPKFNDFRDEQNYYKLLADFNPYDCITEEAAPQGDVQQNYPEGFEDILRQELKGQEGHRQKQEKNQAFDKAMGEIESYLQTHTKADTVYYAEQHGVKLGAKDKKLDAAGKERLAQLRKEGARYSLPKIDVNTTESDRYEILKDLSITVQSDDGSSDYSNEIKSISEFGDRAKSKAEKIIIPLAKDLGILNRPMSAADIDIEFTFSVGNGLKESLSKQLRYGGNFADFAKTIINLDKVINSAILIEKHGDKYKGTIRENRNLENVSVMFSAFRDGNHVIPVQLEIKKSSNDGGRLYLTVAMTKIETSVLEGTVDKNQAFPLLPASITYSLADIFGEINPKDAHFLKYLPDAFLSERQIAAKADAIAEDEARIASYREAVRRKLPVGEDTSPRALLANAFEGVVQNDIEKRNLDRYQSRVAELNAEEAKLKELRAEIRDLSFAKGPKDKARLSELRTEANATANRINTLDKMLLRFEASAPLQGIIEREKEAVRKRTQDRVKTAAADQRKKTVESMEKRQARMKLDKLVLDTVSWIRAPKKGVAKCPDILKKPYMDFLNGIDTSSQRLGKGGDPTKADLRMVNAMSALADSVEKITAGQDPSKESSDELDAGYLDLPADFVKKLRDMVGQIREIMENEGDLVINSMTAKEVRELSKLIKTLNHAIREMSTLYANQRFANAKELGVESVRFLDSLGQIKSTSGFTDFVEWQNALPYYAFKRFGTGGESVFEGLMDAQDKLAHLAKQIFDFQEKTWTGEEADAWSKDVHTIELADDMTEDGEVIKRSLTLTTADAMSIYCLYQREQGRKHLLGGGVRVIGIEQKGKKAPDSISNLTINDIETIIGSLDDRPLKVAMAMQKFMSTVCAEWGNEISMKRFLTREFTESDYFPIESDDENMTQKDPAAQQTDLFRLLNISATKGIDPNANNRAIVRNIFDVFIGHSTDMARLNAFALPLLDYMKWYNYREKQVTEKGQVINRGVRESMRNAYGDAAKRYVMNLIKDVNGRPSDGGLPSFYSRMLKNAKTAAVGSSLRVATLQITSYPRAALVLSPKSLAMGLTKVPNIKRAKEYCGIALWKSFGFYDTNIGRSIEEQMKGVKDVKQKLIELSLKGAEIGDAVTWGALWNACEYEVAATKKHDPGTKEFYEAVGKKLREVVYATQVVDSTLTRSEAMRSKDSKMKELTSFMSEPTLSANILMDAGLTFEMQKRRTGSAKKAWELTKGYVGRALAVYSIGQIAAALMEAFWDAWRDDEDEEYWRKFVDAFVENLVLDIIPFNKIPIVSDIVEAALSLIGLGYFSTDSLSSSALSQSVSAVKAWADLLNGKSSATVYNALYKSTRAVSSILGVSVSGVMREGVALWNNTAGAADGTLKIRTYEDAGDRGEKLYKALTQGDKDAVARLYPDGEKAEDAVRKVVKEKYLAGELSKLDARQMLINYGGVDAIKAHWTLDEWDYDKQNTSEESDDYGKYDRFFSAVESGAGLKGVIQEYTTNGVSEETLRKQITTHFKPLYVDMSTADRASLKGYLLNAMEACGQDREKAELNLMKWDFEAKYGYTWDDRGDAYRNGAITGTQLVKEMMTIAGKTQEEAELEVEVYDWQKDIPNCEITASGITDYHENCEAVGISRKTFYTAWRYYKDTSGDMDEETGEAIPYSKVRKVLPYIGGLDLTPEQKTALALCWWPASTVRKYKTW